MASEVPNQEGDPVPPAVNQEGDQVPPAGNQQGDPVWSNCERIQRGKKVDLKCGACGQLFKRGKIKRMKEHLDGQGNNVSKCKKVPAMVREMMIKSLSEADEKKKANLAVEGVGRGVRIGFFEQIWLRRL
ncbi:hypothetical protein L1987_82335 [Smallanthus sonchifolius]|uniref:Uncharacterized protein n=1 Tax=Smallanthus sonchifolius TaxID=185202 RepID=A0ACB8YB11_9ASTR|nr:hypothetical protein L1987_82335 [Smallanthus sonchifolius]